MLSLFYIFDALSSEKREGKNLKRSKAYILEM